MSLDLVLEQTLEQDASEYSILKYTTDMNAGARTPEVANKLAAEYAAASAILSPSTDLNTLYKSAQSMVTGSEDPRELFVSLAEEAKKVSTDVLKSNAIAQIKAGADPAQVLNSVRAFKTLLDENNQHDPNVLINGIQGAMPMALYDEMNKAADARPFILLDEQVSAAGRTDFNAEDVVDWMSVIFVPDVTTLVDPGIARRIADTGILPKKPERFADIGLMYQEMVPNQKEQFWEQMMPVLWEEYDGNIPKITGAIARITSLDPQGEQTAAKVLDALTIAGSAFDAKVIYSGLRAVGAGVAARAIESMRAVSATNALKKLGRDQAAADLAVIEGTQSGKMVELAKNLSPYKFEGTVLDNPAIVDGIGPEIMARLRAGDEPITTKEGFLAGIERAWLASKADEAAEFMKGQKALTGGRTSVALQQDLVELEARREAALAQRESSSLADLPQKNEVVRDLDERIALIKRDLEINEVIDLAKSYGAKLRAGKVPDEFAPELKALLAKSGAKFDEEVAKKSGRFSADKEVNDVIEQGVQAHKAMLDSYSKGTSFINVARAQFERNKIEAARARYVASGRTLRSAEVVEVSEDGIKIKYTLDNGEETVPYEWNRDALGDWTVQDKSIGSILHNLSTGVLSPSAAFKHLSKELVSNFTLGGMQTARVYNNLMTAARNINKMYKLNAEQAKAVEDLLKLGDETGQKFDAAAMLRTKDVMGRQWSAEEVMAYSAWRNLYDGLWSVQNNAARRSLEFQGYRELHLRGLVQSDAEHVVSTAAREATAKDLELFANRSRAGQVIPEKILVVSDSGTELRALTRDELDDELSQGFEVFRLYSKGIQATKADKKILDYDVGFVLIKRGTKAEVKPLRKVILHYNHGYMPRLYKPGLFYIKDKYLKTYSAFDGRKAAVAHIQKLEAAGKVKPGELRVMDDAEMTPETIELDRLQGAGGLWYMPRRGDPLTYGDSGTVVDRLDLGQSTQAYLASISELLPLNEYRANVMEQFRRAADTIAKKNGKSGGAFSDPSDITNSAISTGDASADYALKQMRTYLSQQLHGRTFDESVFSSFMGSMVDVMEGGTWLGGSVRDAVRGMRYNLRPIDRAKGVVFHSYLGCMNFAQLFVQAQNAVIAASVHPQYAVQAFGDSLAMNAILLMDDAAIDALAAQSKIPLGSYKADVAILKRTGYLDAIFRSADWKTASSGMGHGTLEFARKVLSTGAKPFEAGEAFARIMSFNIAKRAYLAKNPSKKVLDDVDIQAIVQESLRINMNMQKENAAAWQLGALSVPLQFMQVQAKFVENVVGGLARGAGNTVKRASGKEIDDSYKISGLSGYEASRVLAGQLGMYGLVGVPLGYQLYDVIARGYGYVTEDGQVDRQNFAVDHPDVVQAWSEGAMGYGLSLMGANINVSERFSLMASLDDNTIVNVAAAVMNLAEPGMDQGIKWSDIGPFVGVATRVETSIDKLGAAMHTMWVVPESTPEQMLASIRAVAGVASSWNNYEKLRLWRKLSMKFSSSGKPLAQWDDAEMNYQTQLAAALGFQTDNEFWTYHALDAEADVAATEENVSATIRMAVLADLDGNPALHQTYMNAAKAHLDNDTRFHELSVNVFKKMLADSTDTRTRQRIMKRIEQGYGSTMDITVEAP